MKTQARLGLALLAPLLAACTAVDRAPLPPGYGARDVHVVEHAPEACATCRIYARARSYVVRIRTQEGMGAGVVLSSDGLVATNAHVVRGTDRVVVETHDGASFEADVVARDEREDLALVRPASARIWSPAAIQGGRETPVGTEVFVIGHPVGLGWTVSRGIVSAHRSREGLPMIQTDAAISPGSSGGAMVGGSGYVIGIVTAKALGGGVENVAFARPSSSLLAYLAREGMIPAE